MTEKTRSIDLTQLQAPLRDIRDMVFHVLLHGDKKSFLEWLDSGKFEKDGGGGGARTLEAARAKLSSEKVRDLTRDDYRAIYPYLVASLGNKFLSVYARVIENQLKKSLSGLSGGIIMRYDEKELEEIVAAKIGLYVKKLNKEMLLKWVLFLDHLPSVAGDETEEELVRESVERIIDFFEKTTVGEETLQARDWKILKNTVRYFGASRFFLKDSEPPKSSYYGIIPFAMDSLTAGLSRGTREGFIRKSVEQRLSVTRPPVIRKSELRPFLLDGRKNYEVLSVVEAYYRKLKKEMMGRRDTFRIFSAYYEILADSVSKCRGGDDTMLRPEYLDSIYYAMNFEDHRSLNVDGDGMDLHADGKWMRKITAEHLGLTMHPLFLVPVRDLLTALSRGEVRARVPLPGDEAAEEHRREEAVEPQGTAVNLEEEYPAEAPRETAGGPPVETAGPSVGPSVPETGESPGPDEKGLAPPPSLKPEVIRKNRDSRVLPINPANISVMLIGNQPPGAFLKKEEEDEET